MQPHLQNILVISPEAWGQNRLSKHHYASFLAENHTVFFLNPAIGFSKFPFGNMELKSEKVSEGLFAITYKNYLPRLNHYPAFIRRWVYKLQVKKIVNFIGSKPDLVWSFDPRRFSNQHVWSAKFTIYHSVDIHPDSNEKELVQSSRLVVGLSDMICTNLKKMGAETYLTGHGCHVDIDNPSQTILPGENKVKTIYTGNFHKHVDYQLIIRLATENPSCDFILIGPTEPSNISAASLDALDLKNLKEQKNVFLLGSVPGEELYKYLNAANICLVLFKKEFEVLHHAPHKIMAYLASGNVILANHMSGYNEASEDLIVMVDRAQIPTKFAAIVKKLEYWNSPERMQLRKNYAAANHYRVKISQILDKLFA